MSVPSSPPQPQSMLVCFSVAAHSLFPIGNCKFEVPEEISSHHSPCLCGHVDVLTQGWMSSRAEKNLGELSALGHFLKGSSATLGFNKVRDSCQVIQQYGHKLNVDGSPEPDEQVCLGRITDALKTVKVDFTELEKQMKKFFNGDESGSA